MSPVATPGSPVDIANPVTLLPPVASRTPALVMQEIQSWPYWKEVKGVAHKEYALAPERFDTLLREYQRYLGLILLGYTPLGMFSFEVDKIWHSHILASHLWTHFCLTLHGRMINHVPNLPDSTEGDTAMCCSQCGTSHCMAMPTPTLSPSCGSGCGTHGSGRGTVQEFARMYVQAFGIQPPTVWDLSEPEGCGCE